MARDILKILLKPFINNISLKQIESGQIWQQWCAYNDGAALSF